MHREGAMVDDTLKPDLNIQKIADSALGVKRTEETKRKCREAHLGKEVV